MEEAILKRKMPQQKTIAEWAYRAIIGAKVEAADDLSFMQADLFMANLRIRLPLIMCVDSASKKEV